MSDPSSTRARPRDPGWPPGPDAPRLAAGVVHLWRSPLQPDPVRRRRLEPHLSDTERARAARFRFEADAHRFVIARGLLRTLLGRYRGAAPEAIVLEESEHGRPFEPGGDELDFNLSHSGDRVLLAFGRCGRLGVDVEQVTSLPDMAELVELNFSPAERRAWRALPADRRERAFFDCWTRKEAFVKAVGEGLSHPLDAFDVRFEPGREARLLRLAGGDPGAWSLRALEVDPGYAAALAVEAPEVRVEQYAIGEDESAA